MSKHTPEDCQQYNARLIADLLAMLREARDVAIVHKLPQFEARINAAIAKAEAEAEAEGTS